MKSAEGIVFGYGDNVDTDVIIPARYLNTTDPAELASHCMEDIDKDFVSNVHEGDIIVARKNFGCGSSREHAPWALDDYGFRAVIAPSFADIFFNNCFKNGILPIVLPAAEIEALVQLVEAAPGYKLVVDLPGQVVVRPDGHAIPFQIDAFRKECLLNGWDDIGLTLRHAEKIKEFEAKRRVEQPWLFS